MKLIKFNFSKDTGEKIYIDNDLYEPKIFKTVGIFKYFKFKRNRWELINVEYFIFTKLKIQLSKLTISNIIAIASIIVVVIIFLFERFYF